MEKYLLQLIPKNNRVIVPNFGAFIISREAEITVLFNNFLSFNDGLLINRVSEQEGIDITQATSRVAAYVDRIKHQLEEEGRYFIPELGGFSRDKSGILRFEQDPAVADLFESEDLSPEGDDSALLDLDHNDAETSDPIDQEEGEPIPLLEEPGDDSLLTLDPTEEKLEAPREVSAVTPDEPKTTIVPPVTSPTNPSDKAGKKGTLLPPVVIALLILIPIIIVVLYFIFWNRSSSDTKVTQQVPVADTLQQEMASDSTTASLSLSEMESTPKAEGTGTPASSKTKAIKNPSSEKKNIPAVVSSRPYHIIVGSFKNEANAQKKLTSLHSNGFGDATEFENKGMFVVSVLTFSSLSDAQAAQERLMNQQKIESWILLRK